MFEETKRVLPRSPLRRWYVGLVAAAMLAVVLVAGSHSVRGLMTANRLLGGDVATGTVVRVTASYDSREHRTSYGSVVQFTASDGRRYDVQEHYLSSSPRDVGESVRVRYDPADRGIASIDSIVEIWDQAFLPLILGAAALFVVFVVTVLFGDSVVWRIASS